MNANQFAKWLKQQGIDVKKQKKGSGHKDLHNPATDQWSQLPMHGGRKQLGTGLVQKIKKDLGLA